MSELDIAAAAARAKKAKAAKPDTGARSGVVSGAEQLGSGLNEGLASFFGLPAYAGTELLNGLVQRPQFADTTDYSRADGGFPEVSFAANGVSPGVQNPVGGAQMISDAMGPLISDRAPDGGVERFLRRGGQEVGFGVPAALTGASMTRFGAPAIEGMKYTGNAIKDAFNAFVSPYMATSLAGDIGSAVAGQTSQEVAPGNATADLIASLIGGGGASLAASRMTPALAPTPSLEDLKNKAQNRWDTVKSAPETLTDSATAGLGARVRASLPNSQLAREAYPKAFGVADTMGNLKNPRVYDVEEARRIVGDRVASDPAESRVGVGIKREIESYLAGLTPNDLQGGTADDTLDALSTARRTTHQVKKAEAIVNKEMRGESRAASTGSGGNEVNATRQNIRTIFDKERDPTLKGARQGYTPDEMTAMERVVMGTTGSNIARNLGKLAPTSGALPMMATGWGGAAGLAGGVAGGSPLLALPALAGGVGFAAKAAAESMTKKQIEALLRTILNGGKAPGASISRGASTRAVIEQLLSGAANGQPQ